MTLRYGTQNVWPPSERLANRSFPRVACTCDHYNCLIFSIEMFKLASVSAASAVMASSLRGVDVPIVGACSGTSYDFLELVTQWPVSLCSDGTFTCSDSNNWFTLHGCK
jgi:hypothetical protein